MPSPHHSLTQSAHPGRPPRSESRFSRWPWAGLLLALALSLGGAASTPSVQAAPAGDYSKKVYLYVRREGSAERTLCVGDKVDVRVRVLKVVEVVGEGMQFGYLYGVPLQASVADPSVGSISPASSVTSLGSDPVGQERFTFVAKKTGSTTIKVDGKLIQKELFGVALLSDTITGDLPVIVEKCEYRVNATAVWHMEGGIVLIATITDAALVSGGDGKYQGNADVQWVGSTAYPRPCWVVHHPAPSRAYITGEMLGSDAMEVNVIYEQTPALFSTLICPPSRGGPGGRKDMFGNHMLGPDSLRLWVLTSGGSARRNPALAGAQILDGTAVVGVKPVPR